MFPLRDNIPSKRWPIVNFIIIAANLFIFYQEVKLAHHDLLERFVFSFGLIPSQFFEMPFNNAHRIFTSMFLHGSWGHVLSNMWFLYIFGDNVEDAMGHLRYLFFYLLVGVGAAASQLFMNSWSQIPMVGASGAIAGVLGGYFVLYPRARVQTLFIIVIFIRFIEIPAFFFLGFWFLMQFFYGFGSLSRISEFGDVGGVAWWAHAGGFLSGLLLVFFFKRSRRWI